MTSNQIGALFMMGSMAAFTFNDALVKTIGAELPLSQILVVRGGIASVLIYLLARSLGALQLTISRSDWLLVLGRCLSEAGATYLFLSALMRMPIANVTAVLQMLPLTVTLGAALLLREPVGWRRMSAIGAGFCGMLLIVRPGASGFDWASLYALGAVVCVTARDLFTRRMSPQVPSMTVTLMASLTVLCFGLIYGLQQDWQPMRFDHWKLLVEAAGLIFAGYLFSILAMRNGDVAAVSPFRYSGLLWALFLGWYMFSEVPDGVTLTGAAIVVGAGLFTLYRERQQFRR